MRYPHNEAVQKALLALGTTADQVAQNLERGNFKGKRGHPRQCPIANYLQTEVFSKESGVFDIYTYSLTVHVDAHEDDDVAETVAVVMTPDPVTEFIDRYDVGDFPHLVEGTEDD